MIKPQILYEDNHLIVALKPAGVLSQSDNTNGEDMLTILKAYLKEKYDKKGNVYLGLVHRLDRPVAGVMVFAKTSKAASRLSEQIRMGIMHKYYYAVIEGHLNDKEGTLNDRIEKISNEKVLLNTVNGKEASLNYKVLSEYNNYSLLDIELLTGRYHQIRLQFSSRGYPLYGDKKYGSKISDSDIALFAYKLVFNHPITKEAIVFTAEPTLDIFKKFKK